MMKKKVSKPEVKKEMPKMPKMSKGGKMKGKC